VFSPAAGKKTAGQIEKETLKSEGQNMAKIGMDSHLYPQLKV
jgi:hypothetical protein